MDETEVVVEVVVDRFPDWTTGERGLGPRLRAVMHEKLDELLALYESGVPLAGDGSWGIVTTLGWSSSKQNATLVMKITPPAEPW